VIDWSKVTSLIDEIGADSFDEVVELFLDEVDTVITRLKARPDPFLKGSAWNLGFADFGALCQDGERLAARGGAASIDIAAVLDCYQRSKMDFLAGLARAKPRDSAACHLARSGTPPGSRPR